MRVLFVLIQKEFLQIFRNKTLLRMMVVLPIVQLIVLVNTATQEMKENKVIVVDLDGSSYASQLVSKLNATEFFNVDDVVFSTPNIDHLFQSQQPDIVLVIDKDTEKKLVSQQQPTIQLLANAINATRAQLAFSYVNEVVTGLNKEWAENSTGINVTSQMIEPAVRYWYNPLLNYKFYMLPGILVVLVTIIGMFLSAMNLVREKEIGTLEQINVTPVKKYQFILAKLIPFWVIALIELCLGIGIGIILYGIPFEGSLWVMLVMGSAFLFAILGMGLFVSTVTETQQQVMFVSYFFLMVFIMMSGLFTAAENMPIWAQRVNIINPLYYFIEAMRMVVLKGSSLTELWTQLTGILAIGAVMFPLAVYNYRKSS